MSCNNSIPAMPWLWWSGNYGTWRSDGELAQVGDPVARLWDRSANGRHAANGTTAKQMTKTQRGISGDGVDDRYETPIGADFTAITLIAIFQNDAEHTTIPRKLFSMMYHHTHAPTATSVDRSRNGQYLVYFRENTEPSQIRNLGALPVGGAWLALRWKTGAALRIDTPSSATNFPNSMEIFRIRNLVWGGHYGYFPERGWHLQLYDLIIYDRRLTDQEISIIDQYSVRAG